jgi:hypothetical protein
VHHHLPLDHRRPSPRPRALSLSKTGVLNHRVGGGGAINPRLIPLTEPYIRASYTAFIHSSPYATETERSTAPLRLLP